MMDWRQIYVGSWLIWLSLRLLAKLDGCLDSYDSLDAWNDAGWVAAVKSNLIGQTYLIDNAVFGKMIYFVK